MGKEFRPLSGDDFGNVDGGEIRPYFSLEGHYPAQLLNWKHQPPGRWQAKLIFSWQVFLSAALDPHHSNTLPRYYNIKLNDQGKPIFGNSHDYRKDWVAANNGRRPYDWNKLPISIFEKGLYLIEVVTVVRDSKGDLPRALYYSRVNRVIRPLREGERLDTVPVQSTE